MEICLITDTYNPYFDGGAGIYVENLARELSRSGHKVAVIATTEFRDLGSLRFREEKITPNLSVFRFYPLNLYHKTGYKNSPSFMKPLWYLIDIWNPHTYQEFNRLAKKRSWDLVHTHNLGSLSFSIVSAIKKNRLPWIHTIHDYAFLCPRSTLYRSSHKICLDAPFPCLVFRLTKRLFWQHPDVVLAPSRFALDMFVRHGLAARPKTAVLPLGVPLGFSHLKEISRYRQRRSTDTPTNVKILFLGRVDGFKGLDWLLSTFSGASLSGVELHIAGTGPFEKLLRDRYAGPRVKFHGYVQGAKKDALMRACDALIIPSLWYENSPVVIYEAFHYGMPVLGSKIGGIPELVRAGELGYLFEPGHDHGLIRAIQTLASDPDRLRAMSRRCLEVATTLRIESHASELLTYYDECLHASRRLN
jgi:glycosyltransferase involved in cell wall biosynthesis